jgi:RNA polymerase-binding transcription factor DksA
MSGKKNKKTKAKPAKKPPAKAKAKAKAAPKAKSKPAKAAKKPAAKAPARKTAPASKPTSSKAAAKPASKPATASKPAAKASASPAPKLPPYPIKGPKRPQFPIAAKPTGEKPKPLNAKFLEKQKKNLLELRDHILDQMQGVAQDSLKSNDDAPSSAFGMHQADAGSDAYEKDFALSLLSQEQDALYEIEEALKRLENGTYGVCEMSGSAIPIERLEAIPFARYTVQCQEQLEREQRGKNRWDTAPQFMDSAENFFEEEEESEEDSQKMKD